MSTATAAAAALARYRERDAARTIASDGFGEASYAYWAGYLSSWLQDCVAELTKAEAATPAEDAA